MKTLWKMSATFISTFKFCAYQCYAKYVLGIREIEVAETLRMGTNWHSLMEAMGAGKTQPCPSCMAGGPDPACEVCRGTMKIAADPREAVLQALNDAYEDKPLSKSVEDWAAERQKLWIAAVGYEWYYEDDDFEVVAEEIPFEIQLFDEDRNPIPDAVLVGKIDKITRSPQGTLYIDEHKSTGHPIDSDSNYWSHLNLDTQTTLYAYAARALQVRGGLEKYGIKSSDPLIAGVRYDVWHKPQIKPKKLTIAESKNFVKAGLYMDETFEVLAQCDNYSVNKVQAEITPCKKEGEFQIRETAEMYGARLMQDIIENPEKHYARKIVARTDADLKRFEAEMMNIYKTVKFLDENHAWWRNEKQCEATYKCPFIGSCYNNIELDPDAPPIGFKCIFNEDK